MSMPQAKLNSMRRLTARTQRTGASLLELLAVVVIVGMITAVTIPVLAPHAQGRRIREAARMVSTFINAARNRALETGRPAGVWIDRMRDLPEVATTLHFAEIPPLYTGDYLNSVARVALVDASGTTITNVSTANQQELWNIVYPLSSPGQLDMWSYEGVPTTNIERNQRIVHDGDLIRFEGINRYYPLKTKKFPGAAQWFITVGRNAGSISAPVTGKVNWQGQYDLNWWDTLGNSCAPLTRNKSYRYQILRRPQRLQAGSMQLPQGTVIDLNFSSITNGSPSDAGEPFYPRVTTGGTVASPTINRFIGPAAEPNDETPIIIVFSPSGHVEQLYFSRVTQIAQGNTPAAFSSQWQRIEPFGPLYFLIGQRERIVPQEFDDSLEAHRKKNWSHPDSLWVRVNTQSGLVTTSINDPLDTTITTTTGVNVVGGVANARSFSRALNTLGGR